MFENRTTRGAKCLHRGSVPDIKLDCLASMGLAFASQGTIIDECIASSEVATSLRSSQ